MIDNALYGFTRILKSEGHGSTLDMFESSYIDDILIPVNNWDQLPKVEYLDHKVSHNGLESILKGLSALTDLALPGLFRAMLRDQCFSSVRIREIDFAAMMKDITRAQIQRVLGAESVDQGSHEDQLVDHQKTLDLETQDLTEVGPRWIHAYRSFSVLKSKITTTPILRHFDPERRATVVAYDKIYYPVTFASRTLNPNELNYGIAEKEVLTMPRILDLNYNAWSDVLSMCWPDTLLWHDSSDLRSCKGVKWAALLSMWTLEITKCVKREDEILRALAFSFKPRSEMDKALISVAPKKEPRRKIQAPLPTIRRGEDVYAASFDGAARVKRGGGAYSATLWKLPEWSVLQARSGYAKGLTVNGEDDHGLMLWLALLEDVDPQRLVIEPGDPTNRLRTWPDHELLHVKRDWNGSSDSLASAALQRQCGIEVESEKKIQDLVTLNRLDEILVVKIEVEAAQISVVTTQSKTRSGVRAGTDPESLRELRIERIRLAQDEESWISRLKKYLVIEIRDLTQEDAKVFGSIATNYEVDQSDLLSYCPTTREAAADRDKLMQLVVPETLQQDICITIIRVCRVITKEFVGSYSDIWENVSIVKQSKDDHGPKIFNGNAELLIFVDLFSRYVIAKASASRSAQTIAETYEKCVFRRFGASEVIRHDREPGFMSDFFKSFNKILGQRQRATMACR
ncbi:LOW QUALITY PROTEIN: reverse transcriptase [Phytophthora megakarya]|uniref:Reverse transcriptase n=1 Tax=Phytophthora megakarya TaxID=4795 RepID=A0A225W133_9STRA|nr:LOW QUALITY PROTEIN: reverse transcriptase [Phytophthora megakarya]